jgi:ATP-dependent RNA helicase DeaD
MVNFLKIKKMLKDSELKFKYLKLCSKTNQIFIVSLQNFIILMNLFTETNLSPDILKAIGELGYESPTEIQKQTIPFILSDIRDLIALAQTGTGKTAAFSLPILDMIDDTSRKIQLLVLCPTRELCLQITKDIKNYSKYMKDIKTTAVYGGSSIMTK